MGTDDLVERALLQGLIKLAAAYVHGVRGNPAGIDRNLEGARIAPGRGRARRGRPRHGRARPRGARRRHRPAARATSPPTPPAPPSTHPTCQGGRG